METDHRPHRSNSSSSGNTGELFICFTSRLSSSSSMKIASKSILSPGRARDSSQISLSTSLSRRLRTNGSLKGGQASPMFPTSTAAATASTGKKRGCAFENPEPSSPKVTCIGQVRVKTKKQGKKMRVRSKRRGGEVSFRRIEQSNNVSTSQSSEDESRHHHHHQFSGQESLPQRNQRWVHLPVTICEALRAFGAEFNCFLPCRSSCMAGEKDKEEESSSSTSNGAGSNKGSSCGAVFARWLVAVQEGEGGEKGREIELVVGEDEEEEEEEERRRSYRRHVFDEIEFNGAGGGEKEEVEEEEGRVSMCIPPKNALLLMRCRSDPVKMAALSNKFWEPTLPTDDPEEDDEDDNEDDEAEEKGHNNDNNNVTKEQEALVNREDFEGEKFLSCEAEEEEREEQQIEETIVYVNSPRGENEDEDDDNGEDEDEGEVGQDNGQLSAGNSVRIEEDGQDSSMNLDVVLQEDEEEAKVDEQPLISSQKEFVDPDNNSKEEAADSFFDPIHENAETNQETPLQHSTEDIEDNLDIVRIEQELNVIQELQDHEQAEAEPELEPEPEPPECEALVGAKEAEKVVVTGLESEYDPNNQMGRKSKAEEESQPLLPDCLLLMMCEPKLSMEVSKETWVCSTDFIRWPSEKSRPPVVKKKNGGDEPKKRISIDINASSLHNNTTTLLHQPPRSSCSYPAPPPPRAGGAESMATAIEQKLVASKAYEPFVLTRCKSEPMRTAAKLAPEACFWKNRKIEPHRPATLGVGAAGVGF